ncbi:MAG: hypothetical protein C5B53_01175 [Candidatus Melainabacteria bacterium]|nr:MAG: hypothetical protein C5B53_01175 [Candidatus Melainabacteria bacterium]
MRNLKNLLVGCLVLISSISTGPADAEKLLQGAVCSERVHELTSDINWYKSLDKAEEAAQQQGKLIFWVHMLGKIDGAT